MVTNKRRITGNLHLVEDEDNEKPGEVGPEDNRTGELLKALRERVGFTLDGLSEDTEKIAERSKGRYHRLRRPYLINLEKGRNKAETETVRGVLCQAYGITRDQLADYLAGVIALDELMRLRGASGVLVRTPARPTIQPLSAHPRWPELVENAKRINPGLLGETFIKLADSPFPEHWGKLDSLTAEGLAALAWVVQTVGNKPA